MISIRADGCTIWILLGAGRLELSPLTLLSKLIHGRRFPYPKSLYAVEDVLRFFLTDTPDAVVLDFFAGSGTTAHVVMRSNRQDGGRRQCITVTNNEVSPANEHELRLQRHRPGEPEWERRGICDHITKPRLRAAMTGVTPGGEPIEGLYEYTDEFPYADGFDENAEIRCFTRRAVSRLSFQIGSRTAMTWLGVISDTGSSPTLG